MPKKRQQRISHLQHRKPLPFNLASGIIYSIAAISVLALGGMFYNGYHKAQHATEELGAGNPAGSLDVPPGAKVIMKTGKSKPTPPRQSAPAPAAKAQPSSTRQPAPEEAVKAEPAAATPVESQVDMPSIRPLLPKPWSGGYVERANLQQSSAYPTADTCVPILPGNSKELNGGAASELPLQGNDSVILARYDIDRIRGWTIGKVTWHGKLLHGQVRSLGFSALTAGWEEGKGTLKEQAADGATYRWGDYKKQPWREERTPLTHLIRGNGQSLIAYSSLPKPVAEEDQWVSVQVDPIIVQALVAGAANTIVITDEKGQVGVPAIFASREDTNNCHYFEVEGGIVDVAAAGPITSLKAYAHPSLRRKTTVGALLIWTAPGDDGNNGQAFMYEVRYAPSPTRFENAVALPQYKIPWPQPQGQRDQMIIEGLEPDTTYTFFIRARDEAGQVGPVSEVSLKTAPLVAYPKAPAPDSYDAKPIDVASGALSMRVTDEMIGMDPISGTLWDPQTAPSEMSTLWDRNTRTIRLRAAQNETVGFMFSFAQKGEDFPALTFKVQDFQGPKTIISGKHLLLYQTRYSQSTSPRTGLKWRGDALVPIQNKMEQANTAPGQKAQSVYAELHVPAKAEKGSYRGQISVIRNGSESKLNVLLDVLPIRMPDQPLFDIELPIPFSIAALYRKDLDNVADAAPIERAYQEIAHDHRCTLAFVPYSRTGTFPEQVVPKITGKGVELSVSVWTDWDQRFMSYLSGDPFAKNDRGQVHAGHFILPIFENWPTPFADGYLCANEEIKGPDGVGIFAGASDGIYSCMNSDYWRAFRAALKQFADHFKALNFQNTSSHVWLNNGPISGYNGKAPPWSLGTPLYRDDFLALEAFAQVSGSEAPSFPGNRFAFRINVPDPAALAQYGLLRFSILSVADLTSAAWYLLRERVEMTGETLWMQMGALPLEDSTAEIETIGLRYFLERADGWTIRDVVGRPENLARALPQSLIYCGLPLNIEGPLPSLRLKALRRVQQDIDYLLLLQDKMKWTRDQLSEFVYQAVPRLEEGAAISADEIYRLRFAVQELLASD
jgi:hypothetical protein